MQVVQFLNVLWARTGAAGCATAMMAGDNAVEMVSAMRAALDCADIAAAAQRVL